MARNFNPMETRTPVRTISSVMRNAPRQFFQPQRSDFDGPQTVRNPVSNAVTSVINQGGAGALPSVNKPVSSITSTGGTGTTKPVTSVVKPATVVKSASSAVKTTPKSTIASKPIAPVTKPVAPVKPITTPVTKPVTPVKPITTPVTKPVTTPTTKPSTSGLTSVLNNPIVKTIAGAGAGSLIGKVLSGGTKPAAGGTTGGTAGGTKQPAGGTVTPKGGNAPITSKVLTDEEIQAELDRVKASEEAWTPPEGAIDNGDGTYSVIEDGIKTTYNSDGSTAGMEAVDGTVAGDLTPKGDTVVAGNDTTATGEDYFQDGSGNIYNSNGDLVYDATSGTVVAGGDDTGGDTVVAGGDDTGGDEIVVAGDDEGGDDTVVAGDDESDDGSEFAKRGGSIHQKIKGGLPRFQTGSAVNSAAYSDTTEEVQPWQNVDLEYTEDANGPITGSQSLYKGSAPYNPTYLKNTPVALSNIVGNDSMNGNSVDWSDNGDGTASYWDGSEYVTVDSETGNELYRTNDSGQIIDTSTTSSGSSMNGNPVDFTDNGDGTASYWDGNQYVTVDSETGNELYRTDDNGQIVGANNNSSGLNTSVGGGRETIKPVTSAGSGKTPSYASQVAAEKAKAELTNPPPTPDTGVLEALKGYITNNPGLAGGAIGALLSSMMNDAQGATSASPTQPVDISALAAFAPRTTDFGPGMTGGRTGTGSTVVPYQEYDQGFDYQYTPDERLYSDLGISGYLNEPEMTAYTDDQGNPVDQYGNALNDTETTEEPTMAAGGPTTHYTFGRVIDPAENLGLAQGMKRGGLSQAHTQHSHHTNPVVDKRIDFRQGSAVNGAGDGQSDDIPAWLADGEYVMDAELVSMLGNGSNKAGAKVLDKFREEVRAHKRSAPLGKIPPKAKSPLNYIKESMNG